MVTPTSKSSRRPISARTRFEVLKRDEFTCRYCGRRAPDVELHVDHIVPVADGGIDDAMNLVTACIDCNAGKSSIPLSDIITAEDPTEKAEKIRATESALRDYSSAVADREERVAADRAQVYEYFLHATGWSSMRTADFNWLMSTVYEIPVGVVLSKIDAASVSGAPKRAWIPYIRTCLRRWREEGN